MPDFSAAVADRSPAGTSIVARGELDMATAAVLGDLVAAERSPGASVVADLRGVTFCDSTGLWLLVACSADARRDGWSFRVQVGDGPVRRAIELAGIAHMIDLVAPPDPGWGPAGS
jgi:anti-anti-sigma factor